MTKKVLVTEKLAQAGLDRLAEKGLQVDVKLKMSTDELIEAIPDYDALVVRSATHVTREVIAAASKLRIIGRAGGGLTWLSMGTIDLTGDTTKDPLWMCQFAEEHQFNVPGSGSKWALISEGGRMLGLDVTQIPLDQDRIYRNLDVGNPIIVVVGPGDFTTDGHFLVLTGHDGDKITLNDPNSPTNSQKSWDYDTLAGQIQSLWVLRRAG